MGRRTCANVCTSSSTRPTFQLAWPSGAVAVLPLMESSRLLKKSIITCGTRTYTDSRTTRQLPCFAVLCQCRPHPHWMAGAVMRVC